MFNKFIFAPMVQQYSVAFTAFMPGGEGAYVNGDWIEAASTPEVRSGVILPFTDDDLRYAEGGTYSVKDRKLFTLQPLVMGQEIEYQGTRYTIQQFKDLSEYADVYIYVARFGGVDT